MSVRIITGDCLAALRAMPDESVHCCVSSPPYWNLRNYQAVGQIGLEATLQEHVAKIVEVFREVRRVLRKDGVCWLNYGDAYAAGGNGGHRKSETFNGHDDRGGADRAGERKKAGAGFKPKDRLMLPARIAAPAQPLPVVPLPVVPA